MAKKEDSKAECVNKDMTFKEVLDKCPEAGIIMMKYGLHCVGCHVASFETLEQGCSAHGISKEDMTKLVAEINKECKCAI